MIPWQIKQIQIEPHFKIKVTFQDGLKGTVDLAPRLSRKVAGGVFEVLKDVSFFRKAYLHHGTITWPGEVDLAPDAIYDTIQRDGKWTLT